MKYEIRSYWTSKVIFEAEIECSLDASEGFKLGLAVRTAVEKNAVLRNADLRNADLSGADLRNADLRGADLSGADLRGADLSGADLRNADLSGAVLRNAVLRNADLRNADLSGAVLSGADLSGAVLRNAVLRNAVLSGAVLRNAVLSGADLSGADLSGAVLRNADLRSFKADVWMTLTENRREAAGVAVALRAGRVDGSTYEGDCACLVGTIANIKHVDVKSLDRGASRPAEKWFAMINEGDKPGDATGGGFAALLALEWVEEWCRLNGIDCGADAGTDTK